MAFGCRVQKGKVEVVGAVRLPSGLGERCWLGLGSWHWVDEVDGFERGSEERDS